MIALPHSQASAARRGAGLAGVLSRCRRAWRARDGRSQRARPHRLHPAARPAHQRLTLSLDKAAVVQLDTDARDVLVSNPDMVDAVVRTPRRIFLLATKVGQTNAFFFDAAGKQILSLDIRVEKDTVDLASLMKAAMPNSAIAGPGAERQCRADRLGFQRRWNPPAPPIWPPLRRRSQEGRQHARRSPAAQQVMLKVRIAEMDRNVAKQFGINLSAAANVNGVPIVGRHRQSLRPGGPRAERSVRRPDRLRSARAAFQPPSRPSSIPSSPAPTDAATSPARVTTTTTHHALQQPQQCPGRAEGAGAGRPGAHAGRTQPHRRRRAKPPSFLAGGEFPVPAGRDQQGNVSVEFKQFGVGLSASRPWCCRPAASRCRCPAKSAN